MSETLDEKALEEALNAAVVENPPRLFVRDYIEGDREKVLSVAITAYLNTLSGAVGVKALEWVGDRPSAETPIGVIYAISGPDSVTRLYRPKVYYVDRVKGIGSFATLEQAKAAAQADYETRILSAIDHTSTEPVTAWTVRDNPAETDAQGKAFDVLLPSGAWETVIAVDPNDARETSRQDWLIEQARLASYAASPSTGAENAQVAPEGCVLVPQSAIDWLMGSGPDADGKWFGEVEETTPTMKALHDRRPAFWWRSHFRKLIERASPSIEQKARGTATHRHKKRGEAVATIGIGKMQSDYWFEDVSRGEAPIGRPVDMREVAIYRSVDDPTEIWVRPREEFEDGRFAVLPSNTGSTSI